MGLLLKVFFSNFLSNIYLVIGICMGLSLSLFFIPIDVIEYQNTEDIYLSPLRKHYEADDYEPRLNVDSKPRQAQKSPKTLIRPRYYSTELGIREKLFIGVLTSSEYLYSRGTAINKTVAHLVDKIRYFITIPEGTKPNVSLPGIVGFTDTRKLLKPFHALKYIIDNYLEDYDYYFIIKDESYINARKLINLVSKISVSQTVHLGANTEISSFCSLDFGILLSNSIIQDVKSNLDWCVKNTYSDSDDINFGRCITHSSSHSCLNSIQGQTFKFTKLTSEINFGNDFSIWTKKEDFRESLSIYPVMDYTNLYRIHAYSVALESISVQREIVTTRDTISNTVHLGPKTLQKETWPIGNQPGNKAPGRFDVLRWMYFNETHVFLETDSTSIVEMSTDAKIDVTRVINTAVENILSKHNNSLKFVKLINGYRKFDASRGMDYILDLNFIEIGVAKEHRKRVELCKPLGKVEVLPVPYVTENTRVNMILVVDSHKKQETLDFMEHYANVCMEKKHKTFLMMVLLYDFDSPSKGKNDIYYDIKKSALTLTDKYKKDQSKISWLSIRLPSTMDAIGSYPILGVAIADLCAKKFSPESLLFFVETNVELKLDYLNRIRMNTIANYQVFSPIPFVEFHPDVIYDTISPRAEIDINRNYGRYDSYNYNNIAFYVKDYITMRRTVETDIQIIKSDKDIYGLFKSPKQNTVTSLFDMFTSFTDLHAFRAVEPAMIIRYKDINCGYSYATTYETCLKQKSLHLGQRGQLAKLILDYEIYQ